MSEPTHLLPAGWSPKDPSCFVSEKPGPARALLSARQVVSVGNLTFHVHLGSFLPALLPTDRSFLCGPGVFSSAGAKGRRRPGLGGGVLCVTAASGPQRSEKAFFNFYLYGSNFRRSEDLLFWRRVGGVALASLCSGRPRQGARDRARLGNVAPETPCPDRSLSAEQNPPSLPTLRSATSQ